MPHYLNYNGSITQDDTPLVTANNRSFRYGDGLFETMKMMNGHIQLGQYHFDRLFHGMALLQFQWPAYFTADWLTAQVLALCSKNQHEKRARVRLMVFRGDGGLYDLDNHSPNFIIQTWALAEDKYQLNDDGLVIGVYRDAWKTQDRFSNCKSNNYLPYIMAAMYAKQQQLNDCLLLNSHQNICDATIANIFIVKHHVLYTPALSQGCVAGVMRRWLLERLPQAGYSVNESVITVDDIATADEIFLTNAIAGVRWVQSCGLQQYGSQQTKNIYNELQLLNR